jgi:hypothetical protein
MSAPSSAPAPIMQSGPGLTVGPGGLAPIAGGSAEASGEGWASAARAVPNGELALVALLFASASIFFGVFPTPLFHLAAHAGHAIGGIF